MNLNELEDEECGEDEECEWEYYGGFANHFCTCAACVRVLSDMVNNPSDYSWDGAKFFTYQVVKRGGA